MVAGRRSQWGWHRLTDDWARRLVASAGDLQGKLVLDIGAGTGALTEHLLDAGARVIAIELHPERLAVLRERFRERSLAVVRADVADLRLPRQPFVVVANPPFALTTPLLRRLLHPSSRMVSAHLVLQLGAARRWERGEISGARATRSRYEMHVDFRLPRNAFRPRPRVDSVVLRISKRS